MTKYEHKYTHWFLYTYVIRDTSSRQQYANTQTHLIASEFTGHQGLRPLGKSSTPQVTPCLEQDVARADLKEHGVSMLV